jgi:hypothetical protein
MNSSWEILVQHLRAELEAYGGLLALFAEQRQRLLEHDADAVLDLAGAIEARAGTATTQREERERCVRSLSLTLGVSGERSLRSLVPCFPEEVRPLLVALIDETNVLVHRLRRGARQNRELLFRTVELHHETLRVLGPTSVVSTYSPGGRVTHSSPSAAWQAAG